MESTNSSELINSIIESEKFNVGIFLDEDGNQINVSSFWTGHTNYMLCYNFGTDMNGTNSVTVKSKSKQQVVIPSIL